MFGCTGPLSPGMGVTIPMYLRLEGGEKFHGGGGCRARYRNISQSTLYKILKGRQDKSDREKKKRGKRGTKKTNETHPNPMHN